MPSPSSDSPRGSSRGKRAAERPPSRLRLKRKAHPPEAAPPPVQDESAAPTPAAPTLPRRRPRRVRRSGADRRAAPSRLRAAARIRDGAPSHREPDAEQTARTAPTEPDETVPDGPRRSLLAFWFGVLLLGAAALGWSALSGDR